MKIAVIDLELNQPSDKIIQIGAVCLDVKSGKIAEGHKSFNVYVLPDEPMNPTIVNLTGITDQLLKQKGIPLYQALTEFWLWMKESGAGKNISAWGVDYYEVINESKKLGVEYPNRLRCLNIKEMASVLRCSFPTEKSRGGLSNTMELFKLPFVGTPHDAYWDAFNTAKLLSLFQKLVEKSIKIRAMVQ